MKKNILLMFMLGCFCFANLAAAEKLPAVLQTVQQDNSDSSIIELDGMTDTVLQTKINKAIRDVEKQVLHEMPGNQGVLSHTVYTLNQSIFSLLVTATNGATVVSRPVNINMSNGNALVIADVLRLDAKLTEHLGYEISPQQNFLIQDKNLLLWNDNQATTLPFSQIISWVETVKLSSCFRIHHVTANGNGKMIRMDKSDLIVITIPANRTTGYLWQNMDSKLVPAKLIQISDSYLMTSDLAGAGGFDVLVYAMPQVGTENINLGYQRPWEGEYIQTFRLTVVAS